MEPGGADGRVGGHLPGRGHPRRPSGHRGDITGTGRIVMTTTAALVPGISAAGQHYLDQGAREFFETQDRGTRCTWHSPSTATNPRLSRRKTPNEIVPDDSHHSRPDRR